MAQVKTPTITIRIVNNQPEIAVKDWDGVGGAALTMIETKIDRAVHEWRHRRIVSDRVAALAQQS